MHRDALPSVDSKRAPPQFGVAWAGPPPGVCSAISAPTSSRSSIRPHGDASDRAYAEG
jgi:hypothetical protein